MSAEVIIRTVFEAAAVLLVIIALFNEKKLIAFERKIAMRWRTYRLDRRAAISEQDIYRAQETVRNSERSASATPRQSRPDRGARPRTRSRKPAA